MTICPLHFWPRKLSFVSSQLIATKDNFGVINLGARTQFHQRSTYSFYARRSRERKKTEKLTIFFMLLESSRAKAARKMLMKLTPHQDLRHFWGQFHKTLCANWKDTRAQCLTKIRHSVSPTVVTFNSKYKWHCLKEVYQFVSAKKMLMKLLHRHLKKFLLLIFFRRVKLLLANMGKNRWDGMKKTFFVK